MARRSSLASGPENFAATMASFIACSWNSGTPMRFAEHLFQLVGRSMVGMRRGELDSLVAAAAAQIGVDHVALDGAGADDRDLDDEIVEFARLQSRQHVHLRAALDLEHADRIGLAQHVVDGGIVARHGGERESRP